MFVGVLLTVGPGISGGRSVSLGKVMLTVGSTIVVIGILTGCVSTLESACGCEYACEVCGCAPCFEYCRRSPFA